MTAGRADVCSESCSPGAKANSTSSTPFSFEKRLAQDAAGRDGSFGEEVVEHRHWHVHVLRLVQVWSLASGRPTAMHGAGSATHSSSIWEATIDAERWGNAKKNRAAIATPLETANQVTYHFVESGEHQAEIAGRQSWHRGHLTIG
jgi:hypothetical protein